MSRSRAYHDATKYCPKTIANHPALDWTLKPATTKTFHSDDRLDLRPHLALTRDDQTQLPKLVSKLPDGPLDLKRLSTFLLHVYGVTAVANDGNREHTFRAAPSAGALYPNEIYLALCDIEGVANGLYNYQVQDHTLVPVCEGDYQGDLRHCFFDAAATRARCIVLVTAVFYRSAWRYHERGYRRVLLDTGHLVGNAHSIAPFLSLGVCSLPSFQDACLAALLLLDAGKEAVLAAFALDDDQADCLRAPGLSASPPSQSHAAGAEALHRSSYLENLSPAGSKAWSPNPPKGFEGLPCQLLRAKPLDWSEHICGAILLRRSARTFAQDAMTRSDLATILAQSYLHWDQAPTAFHDLRALRTLIAIHRVEGLSPGLYEYNPANNSLQLWRAGRFASDCCHIALEQEIALHCAAMVIHLTDLNHQHQRYGDRGYRYVGLDAGIIGQRLSLSAQALGLGACGIGGYYDDLINGLFGLSTQESVLYLTCLGPKPSSPT
ncbi:MAG: SagB/ThcOx family dehydrogenase [Planctomycetota bacterium]